MRLLMFAIAVVGLALGLVVATAGRNTAPAAACSIGVSEVEMLRRDAALIALVEVVAVGGSANAQPTVTPAPTLTPTATATRGSATATPDPGSVVDDSPTPIPTRTPFNLAGYGATVDVVTSYRGPAGRLQIDAQARAGVERAVRVYEKLPDNVYPPCEPGLGSYRWTPGARYVLFARGDGGNFETPYYGRFRVIEDDVVMQDESLGYDDWGYLVVLESTYNAYFAGIEAERFDGDADREAQYHIRAPRVPLAMFDRMLRNEPVSRPPIAPPITGTGGLRK